MSAFTHFRRSALAGSTFAMVLGAFCGSAATEYAFVAPAHAASAPSPTTPLTLKILKITGNKQVSTDDIMAVLPYHQGDKVTRNEIDEGVQKVMALYKEKNVGAKFGEKERFVNKTMQFYLTIEEMAPTAAAAPAPFVLDKVVFEGNKAVPTSELEAAMKLHQGSEVSTDAVMADTKAIQSVYQKHNMGAQIQPVATQPNHDNHVVLTYKITEK